MEDIGTLEEIIKDVELTDANMLPDPLREEAMNIISNMANTAAAAEVNVEQQPENERPRVTFYEVSFIFEKSEMRENVLNFVSIIFIRRK